jgi:FSR family fosmidomycin resistance protein-like MFS transporter
MNKQRLALLTSTHGINDMYQGMVPALLPFMMLERGYSYAAISGLMLAATGLSSIVQPLFGLYADKTRSTTLVPVGFLVAAFGVVLAGMATEYWLTWLALALSGLGIAAYHPPATVAARAAGGASQKAMSIFSVGGTIGASFAPLLAALTISGDNLSRSYLLAIPAVMMAGIWFYSMSGASRRSEAANRHNTTSVVTAQNDWRAFGWLVAMVITWSIPYVITLSMVSLFITRDLSGTAFLGATALTCFTAAGAIGTLAGGAIADRLGRMTTIRIGYALMPFMLAGLVFASTPIVAAVFTALLGMTMFLPFSAMVTLSQDYLPRNPATASGITLGLAISVGGLTSPLFGMLSDAYGLSATFLALLGVLCTATCIAFRLKDRALHQEDVQPAAA